VIKGRDKNGRKVKKEDKYLWAHSGNVPHTHAVSANRPKTKSDPLQQISRVNEEGQSRFGEGELRWKS